MAFQMQAILLLYKIAAGAGAVLLFQQRGETPVPPLPLSGIKEVVIMKLLSCGHSHFQQQTIELLAAKCLKPLPKAVVSKREVSFLWITLKAESPYLSPKKKCYQIYTLLTLIHFVLQSPQIFHAAIESAAKFLLSVHFL